MAITHAAKAIIAVAKNCLEPGIIELANRLSGPLLPPVQSNHLPAPEPRLHRRSLLSLSCPWVIIACWSDCRPSQVRPQESGFVTTKLVIVGLPGSGKTTVFNALTQSEITTGGFSGQDEAHLAVVKVPDRRLDILTEMFQPQRKVPADIQYVDVGGLSKGMAEKGLSGQLLGN